MILLFLQFRMRARDLTKQYMRGAPREKKTVGIGTAATKDIHTTDRYLEKTASSVNVTTHM